MKEELIAVVSEGVGGERIVVIASGADVELITVIVDEDGLMVLESAVGVGDIAELTDVVISVFEGVNESMSSPLPLPKIKY